jgi:uncharacterized protein (DUF2235 family)
VKRLVVAADGTWSAGTQAHPTNVVKLARLIAPVDRGGNRQIVRYHEGIGTSLNAWKRFASGVFGAGVVAHIRDVYLFLVDNFEVGDEIWLFGFSRGAFIVRSAAGLIRNVGLLRHEHASLYDRAYELYRRRGEAAHPCSAAAEAFRAQYAHEPRIRFIGAWETIGTLGIPATPLRLLSRRRYQFHDVELSGRVDFAYQALAIDERRKPFEPSLWKRDDPSRAPQQVLEQAWFPGVHGDIGGGYADTGLSDESLLWMIDGARRAGLAFTDLDGLGASYAADTHESMTFGYRLLGDGTRAIGRTNPGGNEHLAPCTEKRRRELGYNPGNVAAFLRGAASAEPVDPVDDVPGRDDGQLDELLGAAAVGDHHVLGGAERL